MDVTLAAMGVGGMRARRVRCAACGRSFPASLAGPGDEARCTRCGMIVVIGERAHSALRVPRSGASGRVADPLRVVVRCLLLAAASIGLYLLALHWGHVTDVVAAAVEQVVALVRRLRES